mmetsp:Transcript_104852/g.296587  ORF Transcript_104852/g.296587 Transcript_104852/m.296587 type:complete len:300 (-) Transcript_104852:103-1002(-)
MSWGVPFVLTKSGCPMRWLPAISPVSPLSGWLFAPCSPSTTTRVPKRIKRLSRRTSANVGRHAPTAKRRASSRTVTAQQPSPTSTTTAGRCRKRGGTPGPKTTMSPTSGSPPLLPWLAAIAPVGVLSSATSVSLSCDALPSLLSTSAAPEVPGSFPSAEVLSLWAPPSHASPHLGAPTPELKATGVNPSGRSRQPQSRASAPSGPGPSPPPSPSMPAAPPMPDTASSAPSWAGSAALTPPGWSSPPTSAAATTAASSGGGTAAAPASPSHPLGVALGVGVPSARMSWRQALHTLFTFST